MSVFGVAGVAGVARVLGLEAVSLFRALINNNNNSTESSGMARALSGDPQESLQNFLEFLRILKNSLGIQKNPSDFLRIPQEFLWNL